MSVEVKLESPQVHLVASPTKDKSQKEIDKDWRDAVNKLVPFKINHFAVRDGSVHFHNYESKPPIDIFVENVKVDARNLTNTRSKSQELFATLTASGNTIGNGVFKLHVKANPFTKPLPAFDLDGELKQVNLLALNPFFKKYGGFDVEKGKFELFMEVTSKSNQYKGYLKPLFEDIDVFSWKKDTQRQSVLKTFWEAVVGTTLAVFKNQPKDRLATKVEFSGTWNDNDVDIFSMVGNLLKNAFIQVLLPKLDQELPGKMAE